uniref:Uncharacterized protein n=1 Tax=Lepeophtheirus salmonis TaxID=72036 RepID=A0A0K2SYZ7_LEPSM
MILAFLLGNIKCIILEIQTYLLELRGFNLIERIFIKYREE